MGKQLALIGVGNCGSQVASLFYKRYPDLADCIYINTSEADLSMVEGNLKFKLGEDEEIEGSGKNRAKMKVYLQNEIERILTNETFSSIIEDKKYVFVISSTAGGTGSGASPILLDVLRNCFADVHFILVGVLPQLQASLMEQGNTLEFLNELYQVLGDNCTYMIYDNETTSNKSPTESLEIVNDAIVEDIRILTGIDNYPTPYDSIDEADMESIITTSGRMIISRIKKGITEKALEDSDIGEMIVKSIKSSCHTETDRNKRVVRWGIITYFTEQVNRLYTSDLEKLHEFIGTPVERFNHHAINDKNENLNFLYLIASGLSPINDRVKRITDRVNELKEALAKDESSRYILSGEDVSYDATEERRKEQRRKNSEKEIRPKDLFKKFMK